MADSIERVLFREASLMENYTAMDKLKIGILGISAGAGASFFAGCFARYLANTRKHCPAVVELGGSSLFDSYGMDKRFAGRTWFHFYQALSENRSIRGMRNMDEGINWILRAPNEELIRLSFEQKLQLTCHARGDIIFCDLSGDGEPEEQLLLSMDQIIAVIDPMPSKMLSGFRTLSNLKTMEAKKGSVIYVVSKMNKGVNRRQMLDFLKVRNPFFLPMIQPESIYTAEFNCKVPYTIGEVKRALQSPLGDIASALFFS